MGDHVGRLRHSGHMGRRSVRDRPRMGLRHGRVLAMSGTLKQNDMACARGRIDPYGTSTRPRGVSICPGAGNAKNGERVLKTLRAETCSTFRIGVNMSARGFWIYSLSFLVSRQREGRRADLTSSAMTRPAPICVNGPWNAKTRSMGRLPSSARTHNPVETKG